MKKKIVFISCELPDQKLAEEISNLLALYHIDSYISCIAKSCKEKIEHIQCMKVLVLLFSNNSVHSSIIDNEITEAINNQIPIVPFQVDDTSIKENLSFDFILKKSQWVLGYPDKEKQLDNLIVSICRFLGIDAIEKNPTDPFEQLKRGIALEYGTNGLSKDRKEAMLWLTRSAQHNNALAMFELYKLHLNSDDDNDYRDYNKAKKWLIKSANAGFSDALYVLGTQYEVYDENCFIIYSIQNKDISYPLQIVKDLHLARKYYEAAAEQGNKKAMFRLGILCLHGTEDMLDHQKAFKLLSAASEIDNQELWLELGLLYKEKNKIPIAIECFQKAKFAGEYELSLCLLEGTGINKNYIKAKEIVFHPRHEMDPRYNELKGLIFERGLGVTPDLSIASRYYLKASKYYNSSYSRFHDNEKAFKALEKAADLNNVEANYYLALFFLDKEDEKAYMLFKKAAILGLPIAKFYVAYCFLYGVGIKKNYDSAFHWLSQADIPGLAYATYLLGELYLNGVGIITDYQKALDCFYRAANQNQPNAEYRLYQFYNEGLYVAKNPIAAKDYYERAKTHGLQV